MKHLHTLAVVLAVSLNLSCSATAGRVADNAPPKNIILFIADGAGPSHFTMGRDFARFRDLRGELFLDPYLVGSVRTYSAKERVTDSASSATAYATGMKTYNGAIAVDTMERPVQTVLEVAERRGLATGLVATSRVTHATPASFSAHTKSRSMESDIAAQQIDQGIEVIFGGGWDFYLPESEDGDREDGRNLLVEAENKGYVVVQEEMMVESIRETPVLALLAPDHLPFEIDRGAEPHVKLADLTRKAIELLSTDEDGFFLMVEGSRIDHAAHENDAAAAVYEVLAYDDAFKVAVDFAREEGNTLIVAVSDHETGGMSLGRSIPPDEEPVGGYQAPTYWKSLYGRSVYAWRPSVLASVHNSGGVIADLLRAETADIRAIMADGAGIDDLTSDEFDALSAAKARGSRLQEVVDEVISRRAFIGWTTGGHTAEDVNLYAYGPGSEAFAGNIQNAAVGANLLRILGAKPGLVASRRP